MEKILFKDYPNIETPIDANNLNTMQDNAEASITNLKNQVANGWYEIDPTAVLTFSSWGASVYTGVVSTNIDLTSVLSVGMKVKFTQNATTKYGIITAISSSTITMFMGTDYTLENASINNFYFSMLKAPFDFPMNPEKWELTFVRSSNDLYSTTTTTNYYGGTNNKLTVPVGTWEVEYNYTIQFTSAATSCYSRLALSQSSSEVTERSLVSNFVMPLTSGTNASQRFINSKIYNLTEEATFYLLFKNDLAYNNLYFVGSSTQPSWIKAKCTYL